MKKILLLIAVMVFGVSVASAQVVTIGALVKAVGAAVALYKAAPDAEYIVTIVAENGQSSTHSVSSATAAIKAAIVALENGAHSVNLDSAYPTVHPSCRNKTYYRKDINYLRSR